MKSSCLRTALAGTVLALALPGCSAPADPTPTPTAAQTPPPAATTPPAAVDPTGETAAETAETAEQVEVMRDLWESAAPEQRDEALRAIGVDPAAPQPSDDAVSTLVEKAAEFGYVVSEDAAREFLSQISG